MKFAIKECGLRYTKVCSTSREIATTQWKGDYPGFAKYVNKLIKRLFEENISNNEGVYSITKLKPTYHIEFDNQCDICPHPFYGCLRITI